jgi:hypothetical protein
MRAVAWADAHLVPEWRKAHRFISVRAAALNVALLATWATLPDDLKNYLPRWLLPVVALFILIVGTAGVMVNQKKLITDKPDVRNP